MNEPFFARRSLLILVATGLLMPLVYLASMAALATNRNNVEDWLPDNFPETTVHRWFWQHFPNEGFVVVSWEGCRLGDQRLEDFARELDNYDPLLEELELSSGTRKALAKEGLSTLSEVEACDDLQRLPGMTPRQVEEFHRAARAWQSPFHTPVLTGDRLLEKTRRHFPELSRKELLDRLEGLLIGPDLQKTCLLVTLTDAAAGHNLRPTLENIRRVARLVGVEPPEPPPEPNLLKRYAQEAQRFVRELILGRETPSGGIHMGGPPVDNVAIDIEGERTLFRLAGLAGAVGLLIAWLVFRNVRLTLIVFVTALLSTGTALGAVYLTGGTCDSVLLSMPALIYVLAISASVHIVNYYHDAIRHHGLTAAPSDALARGWLPCTVAALTTALGLGSLCTSHVVPIRKFGFYSAIGVLVTLAWVFLLLPACLHFFPSRRYAQQHGGRGDTDHSTSRILRVWLALGGRVVRRGGWISVGCAVVMLFFAVGLREVQTSVKLMKLFSADAPILTHYAWLEEHLGPLVPMEVVIRVDNQRCPLDFIERMRLVDQVEQALEQLEAVGATQSAATFAPDLNPREGQSGVVERIMGIDRASTRQRLTSQFLDRHRAMFRGWLADDRNVAVACEDSDPTLWQLGLSERLVRHLETLGFESLHDLPPGDQLARLDGIIPADAATITDSIAGWRHRHRNPTLAELNLSGPAVEALRAAGLDSLVAIQRYADEQSETGPPEAALTGVDGLTPDQAAEVAAKIDRWLVSHGDELWRVSARVPALGDVDYGLFVDDIRAAVEPVLSSYRRAGVEGIEAIYTGVVPLVYKTQHELMQGLFNSLVLAFLLIAVVMIVVLRSLSAGLLSMIPNVFPVVVIFGAMGWLGILVDIGTMMTASVALGVAVDDTIHFLTWYRRGLDRNGGRKSAIMLSYERCAAAMTQTTLIGGLGLAVFAFSTFMPTQRFGTLMLVLLATALVGDLIFLPSLLCGPIGRFFRGRVSRKNPAAPSRTDLPTGT